MSITIKDISELAHVSPTTVSRVLNGRKTGYSYQTKQRIIKIAEKYSYRPNAIAKGLVTKKTKTIGLIIPDITNPFFPEIARGVEDGAMLYGYSAFLCNSDDKCEKEKLYIQTLEERCIDGIIFTMASCGDHQVKFVDKDIPIVLIDRKDDNVDIPCMIFENRKGGYLAGKHLAELGHTSVACITGPKTLKNDKERVEGFKQAFLERGIKLSDDLFFESNYRIETGEKIAEQILRQHKVSAIFATNDLTALGIYEAAHKLKISIPKQLSVVGFDDVYISRFLNPMLTTVHQPTYEMGNCAAKVLIDIIENNNIEKKTLIFQPELVIRESTAKAD